MKDVAHRRKINLNCKSENLIYSNLYKSIKWGFKTGTLPEGDTRDLPYPSRKLEICVDSLCLQPYTFSTLTKHFYNYNSQYHKNDFVHFYIIIDTISVHCSNSVQTINTRSNP